MKQILREIVAALEEVAASAASLETALIQTGALEPGELNRYQIDQRAQERSKLARIHYLIASLPDDRAVS